MRQPFRSGPIRVLTTALVAVTVVGSRTAHAEVSDRTKMVIWSIDNFTYLGNCRFDKEQSGPPPSRFECEHGLEEQQRRVDSIPSAERAEAEVKRALAQHERTRAYVAKVRAAAEQQEATKRNARNEQESWSAAVSENERGLRLLDALERKQEPAGALLEGVEAALALGPFAGQCAARFAKLPAMKRTFTTESRLMETPARTCALATDRERILKEGVTPILATWRETARGDAAKSRARILRNEPIEESALRCAQDSAACVSPTTEKIEKLLGLPRPAPTTDAAEFQKVLRVAIAKRRVGALHDGVREGAVVRALRSESRAFIATGIYVSADDIKKNSLGIPLQRSRGVSVLTQVPGESFCRSYMAYAIAPYEGGGRYGAFRAELFEPKRSTFLVSSCK